MNFLQFNNGNERTKLIISISFSGRSEITVPYLCEIIIEIIFFSYKNNENNCFHNLISTHWKIRHTKSAVKLKEPMADQNAFNFLGSFADWVEMGKCVFSHKGKNLKKGLNWTN